MGLLHIPEPRAGGTGLVDFAYWCFGRPQSVTAAGFPGPSGAIDHVAINCDDIRGCIDTLRKDGMPITLPIWFVMLDRKIYVQGPAKTKKFNLVRNDPRCSFLVESGKRWAELRAVQLNGQARIVEDEAMKARVKAAMDAKYDAFRSNRTAMPEATVCMASSRPTPARWPRAGAARRRSAPCWNRCARGRCARRPVRR